MKYIYYIIVFVFLSLNTVIAQRVAVHTLTNFNVNTSTNKFSFNIYSQRTSVSTIRVGTTSYLIYFNNLALTTPVMSNINSKYTVGSATGDYDAMTVGTSFGNEVNVTINFTGNGDGTGDLLSNSGPIGELICTVTLDITNQSLAANISWDEINSAMQTPSFQAVTNSYSGSFNGVLPVELSSFTSKLISNKVQLNWSTKTEVNNYGFDVERKVNGDWQKIGFVNGNGNSNSPKEYTYTDKTLIGGSKFLYRLKQIDSDGQFEYSDAVEVEVVPNKFELSQNYPNPFNPTTKIRYQLPDESKVVIKIYNILGSEVMELLDEQKEAGVYEVEFKADNLSSGTYIYKIIADNFVQTKKMILLK